VEELPKELESREMGGHELEISFGLLNIQEETPGKVPRETHRILSELLRLLQNSACQIINKAIVTK
jgi:hypothetical protein